MSFWSDNHANGGTDPKRNFRFKVRILGMQGEDGSNGYLYYAKTVTKPSFAINAAEHKFLNHTFYYPGAVTWNDVTVTLVDPQDPDSVINLAKMIQDGNYKPPGTDNDLATMSKSSAVGAVKSVEIVQLNAEGKEIETWNLWNPFATDLKFGDLEYGNDDLTELTVTFKYDWATVAGKTGDAVFKS